MIQSVLLKNDVYWLGVLDPNLDVFDIIMETKYGTTYNSYLVNTTEGAILVDHQGKRFVNELKNSLIHTYKKSKKQSVI